MGSVKGLLLALGLIMLVMPSRLYGQAATASASADGIVTDNSGAIIPGAVVSITNQATQETRSARTTSSGLYRFDFLVPGTYTIRVSMKGFKTYTSNGVVLFVNHTTTVNATLLVGSASQTVMVSAAAAPLSDVTRTSINTEITQQQIQDVPLNGRDLGNLALLAPGTEPVMPYDSTKKHVTAFAVNDSMGEDSNLTVNGIDDRDDTVGGQDMQLPLSAIQEFSVSTERFSAENGRAEGAAINVVTKSGTNNWHGGGYIYGTDTSLNANNYFSEEDDEPTPEYDREQFGGDFGGPIRQNRAWFFGAIERDREQTQLPETALAYQQLELLVPYGAKPAEVIPTPYYDWRYNGRIDYRINDKNIASLIYTGQSNTAENDLATGLQDLTSDNSTANHMIVSNFSLDTVVSPTTANVVTIGYQYWHNAISAVNSLPYELGFPEGTTQGGIGFGSNTSVPQESIEKKWQFADDISKTYGSQTISIGAGYIGEPQIGFSTGKSPVGELDLDFGALPNVILSNSNGLYPEGLSTPGAVISMTQTAGQSFSFLPGGVKSFGTYFQDNWNARKGLTFNLGARWDKDFNFQGESDASTERTYLILKAINSPFADGLVHNDNKDISPRLGFAWDIHGDAKNVLRGGYGLYFGQSYAEEFSGAIQEEQQALESTVTNLTWPGPGSNPATTCPPATCTVPGTDILLSSWRFGIDPFPTVPTAITALTSGASGTIVDPHYRNPLSEEWNAGYTHLINSKSVITADYIHLLGLHESRSLQIDPTLPSLDGARPLSATLAAADEPVLSGISDIQSIGRSRYDALETVYKRQMTSRVSINAAYTLARGVSWGGDPGGRSSGIYGGTFQNVLQPWNAQENFGPDFSDERNHVTISGIVKVPWGIEVAPYLTYGSARPWTALAGQDVLGQGSRNGIEAVVPVNDPTDYLELATQTPAQDQACMAAGTCEFAGQNTIRGDPFFELDSRVMKTITFKEKYNLDLLAQFFNLTNRANFGNGYANSVLDGSSFGTPDEFLGARGVSSTFAKSFRAEFGAQFHF